MMNSNWRLIFGLAFAGLAALGSCGHSQPVAANNNSFSISIEEPSEGWAQSIAYESSAKGTFLTLDGVIFELKDWSACDVDWDAVGMSDITTTRAKTGVHKVSYTSTETLEATILSVMGRAVEIADGVLIWGSESLGEVSEGDVFVVDGSGLRAK